MAQTNDKPQEKKEKTFTVKVGSLMVGNGDLRKAGAKVKESELTRAELKFFTADGTIEESK
jgi:hypothetical protein